jgi:hypothetical protein
VAGVVRAVGKGLVVACITSLVVALIDVEAAAKEIVAVRYAHVGKPVKIGPYVVTIDGVATASTQGGNAVASITFEIRNTSRRGVGMPGAVASCPGTEALEGTSLVRDLSQPSSLGPRQTHRHVVYRFQSSATGCAVPEVRLQLDSPGNGRFTQLRIPATHS